MSIVVGVLVSTVQALLLRLLIFAALLGALYLFLGTSTHDTWARTKEEWKTKWAGWKKGVDKTKDTPKKEDGKNNDKQQQDTKTDWWGIVNKIYRGQKEEDVKEKKAEKKKTKKKKKEKDESKNVKDKALSKLRALRRSKKEESEK